VTDFGHAKVVSLKPRNSVYGTVAYKDVKMNIFLRQERERAKLLEQSNDCFSFGALLWELCAGRPPREAMTSVDLQFPEQAPDEIMEIEKLDDTTPTFLRSIVELCLDQNPSHRPSFEDIKQRLIQGKSNLANSEG